MQALKHEGGRETRKYSGYHKKSKVPQKKLWDEFFSNPHQWWDHRKERRSERSPDFVSSAHMCLLLQVYIRMLSDRTTIMIIAIVQKHRSDYTKALWATIYNSKDVKPSIKSQLEEMDGSEDPRRKASP